MADRHLAEPVPDHAHDAAAVDGTLAALRRAGLPERVVVDASRDNSGKDHVRQAAVAREIAARIAAGERGISGVMLESLLLAGRQDVGPRMTYGRSVTGACELAAAVAARR